jgi:cold shock CspA family protein
MSADSPARRTGTVKRLLLDRGFGFIRTVEGTEYFFHRSSCGDYDGLHEGALVSFRIVSDAPRGRAPGQGCRSASV